MSRRRGSIDVSVVGLLLLLSMGGWSVDVSRVVFAQARPDPAGEIDPADGLAFVDPADATCEAWNHQER